MSTDTVRPQRAGLKPNRRTVQQLLDLAARDKDPVSVFGDGTCQADTDTAIFVVKGRQNIDYLCGVLTRQGLLDVTKPVTAP